MPWHESKYFNPKIHKKPPLRVFIQFIFFIASVWPIFCRVKSLAPFIFIVNLAQCVTFYPQNRVIFLHFYYFSPLILLKGWNIIKGVKPFIISFYFYRFSRFLRCFFKELSLKRFSFWKCNCATRTTDGVFFLIF